MLKKAFLLVSGNAFGSALLLLRNLIVARIVSPEDYGIASTFAVAMSIIEMLSYLGLNQMIVVDKDGDEPSVQRAMQGFQVLRGLISSVILFSIAHPYARFLGVEHVAWAYQVIALIPFINGLQHFDIHRLKRHMKFTPLIVTQAVPPLIAVLSVWPIAYYFDDYRIMLISLIIQSLSIAVLSHVMAERRYGLSLDLALMRRATIFGWPLLLNGALLFGVFNGERLIVGRELGMSQLAVFSMAITLTLTPSLVLAGACQSLFLPQLSRTRDKLETFRWMSVATVEAGLVIGLVLILGMALVGGPLVSFLLGPKYYSILPILIPMTIVQAIRVAKTGASTVALSRERTGNAMASNLIRVLSLPLSWVVLIQTGDVMTVIWISAAAEVAGYLVSIMLASRRADLPLRPLLLPSILSALACCAAVFDSMIFPPKTGFVEHLHWAQAGVALTCIAAIAAMTNLRGYIRRRLL